MESDLIISVHVPKTAGISLLTAWEEAFPGRVLRDYPNEFGDEARHATAAEVSANQAKLRDRYDVIHGHFPADKYVAFVDDIWLSFLRDPLDRLISLHEQMRRRLERGRTLDADRERLVTATARDPATVTEFASLIVGKRGSYRRFVGSGGLDRFRVVGITERYERSLELFEGATGCALSPHETNTSELTPLKQFVGDTPAVAEELRSILRPDIEIYEEAVARFEILSEAAAGSAG